VSAPQATDQLAAPPPTEPDRLHRPVRAVVAIVELVVAGFAVWGAFWAWPRGFATITTTISDGTELDSERVLGNWLAFAIAFGTLAALLVLDAVRQLVLATRVRPAAGKPVEEPAPEEQQGKPGGDTVSDAKVTGED
jgi:hypothetical protein